MSRADLERRLIETNIQLGQLASELLPHELWWKGKEEFLASRGYTLRPRFRKDWTPSWLRSVEIDPLQCEDAVELWVRQLEPILTYDHHLTPPSHL